MKKIKVNVGWMQEGTITGAIHRNRFAGWVATYKGYLKLLSYVKHDDSCPREHDHRGDCDCGLNEFLRTGYE